MQAGDPRGLRHQIPVPFPPGDSPDLQESERLRWQFHCKAKLDQHNVTRNCNGFHRHPAIGVLGYFEKCASLTQPECSCSGCFRMTSANLAIFLVSVCRWMISRKGVGGFKRSQGVLASDVMTMLREGLPCAHIRALSLPAPCQMPPSRCFRFELFLFMDRPVFAPGLSARVVSCRWI